MDYPDFMRGFPSLDIPYPEEVVSTNVIRSDAGLVVFFTVHQDVEIQAVMFPIYISLSQILIKETALTKTEK